MAQPNDTAVLEILYSHRTINFLYLSSAFYPVILCPAMGFVTILLKARQEELIDRRIDKYSFLLHAIYEVLQMGRKKRREDMHPGLDEY